MCNYDWLYFFFFKQKTAYEIRLSLVGSEMCIRDRINSVPTALKSKLGNLKLTNPSILIELTIAPPMPCLLYTSDAADE